jgi:hypothetical protein
MKVSASLSLLSALYAVGTAAQGPVVSCRNNICYSLVVPETTVSSGNGSIYFQIYAPTTFSWVALATGTSMSNANMFIMYQDGNGNVTISPRQASGHSMPTVPSTGAAELELLDGSGVSNGFMVANVRCDNCESWKGTESLDFTSEGADMVGAWSEGDALNSTDVDARIGIHTGNLRPFTANLTQASIADWSGGNPFVGANAVPAELSGNTTTDGGDDGSVGSANTASFIGSAMVALACAALML